MVPQAPPISLLRRRNQGQDFPCQLGRIISILIISDGGPLGEDTDFNLIDRCICLIFRKFQAEIQDGGVGNIMIERNCGVVRHNLFLCPNINIFCRNPRIQHNLVLLIIDTVLLGRNLDRDIGLEERKITIAFKRKELERDNLPISGCWIIGHKQVKLVVRICGINPRCLLLA